MTVCGDVITHRLEEEMLDSLRKEGFIVADDATGGFFAGMSVTPELSKALRLLVSSVIALRKSYLTKKGSDHALIDEVYTLRARLEEDGVSKESLNDLIGKIREITPRDSLGTLLGEEGRPE